jgi:hypothetical protein
MQHRSKQQQGNSTIQDEAIRTCSASINLAQQQFQSIVLRDRARYPSSGPVNLNK